MSLKDQHVVVIGGSSGIGFAVAQAAAAEGARVTIGSSSAAKVEAATARLGNAGAGFTVDVTDKAGVARAFLGLDPFDHLVFTAGDWGGPRRVGLKDLDLDAAPAIFGVRFWGALAATKAALGKISPHGSITLTNGLVAHRPPPGAAVSSAMAGAVEHLARGLAVELAPLRVNCVCPGFILTGVWDSIPADQREARIAEMTRRFPLARAGEPSETAEAYLFLMRCGYATGQVVKVDGGMGVV